LPEERQLLSAHPGLLVRSKADLVGKGEAGKGEGVLVSVVTGEGLDHLRHAIAAELFGSGQQYADPEPHLSRERHRVALERAGDALASAGPALGKGGDPVLAAHHVRDAVAALDELIGLVHPDEVLGRVFERFCVGK
jgi:tRNA modification GTPase